MRLTLLSLISCAFSKELTLNVALQQHNTERLKSILLDVSNPKSKNYGNYMEIDHINHLVAPPDKDKVINWLDANNIDVLNDYGDGLKISGSYSTVEDLFSIKYSMGRHNSSKIEYTIPEEFKSVIEFVEGFTLLDYTIYPDRTVLTNPAVDNRYVGREAFEWLYNITTDNQCGSSSIASVEYGTTNGFSLDDLHKAQTLNNVSLSKVDHSIDASSMTDVESQLDMQMMAINIGENSDLWYWGNNKWLYSLAVDVFNNQTVPDILSMSYGWAEDDQCSITTCGNLTSKQYVDRVNMEYIKLGLRGISIVVSSGDAGSPGRTSEQCDPARPLNSAFPGSSPWITSVGATYVVDNNNTRNWTTGLCKTYGCIGSKTQSVTNFNEVGWTSGGGFAKLSERLSIQNNAVDDYINSGVSLPKGFSQYGRAYPDLSVIGHYCPVVDNGGLVAIDGTSCSAPLFATILSLLNKHQVSRNKPRVGFVNPMLYMMYYENDDCFDDIVEGNTWCTEQTCCDLNERNGSDFGFKAKAGYDPVYGLGTPNVGKMKEWLDRNT